MSEVQFINYHIAFTQVKYILTLNDREIASQIVGNSFARNVDITATRVFYKDGRPEWIGTFVVAGYDQGTMVVVYRMDRRIM